MTENASAPPAPQGSEVPPHGEGGSSGRGALLVASGIFLSRIFGLVRTKFQTHYLGIQSEAADALAMALRLPNFLQNLLGEGVLSASFIPSYTALMAKGDHERAKNLAGAVFSLLALAMSIIVLGGILLAPLLVGIFSTGWTDSAKTLAVTLVRIVFPGTGLLVLSAWCLAVLNSHRRFLLSYTAPVVWNIAIIAAIVFGAKRGESLAGIAWWAAVGAVAGSLLQFAVQLPAVLSLTSGRSWSVRNARDEVRHVFQRFLPAVTARGSVQLSGYVDLWLVGRLAFVGSLAALANAQTLYQLPISLFGMAVSAAELPEISSAAGGDVARDSKGAAELRRRLGAAVRRTMFFVLPSAAALAFLGDHIVALLWLDLDGAFGVNESVAIWVILIGFSVGIVPATLGRLVATSFFAMHDTRTPLRFALARIVVGALLSVLLLFVVPRFLPADFFAEGREVWRVAGLSIGGSIAFWLEFALLRAAFVSKLGSPDQLRGHLSKLLISVVLATAVGLALRFSFADLTSKVANLAVIGGFGITYLVIASILRVSELSAVGGILRRR